MPERDVAYWMWADAVEFLDRAERLHRQFFRPERSRPARLPKSRPSWEPPVDLFETESALWIVVALPGVAPAELSVVLEGGSVIVSGERRMPPEFRTAAIHRLEVPYGRFERQIPLPAGRYEIGQHALSDGCLTLCLHKSR